jgi:lysozyme
MPDGWSTWRFWQTSNAGAVAGIEVPVDVDEFNGALGELVGAVDGEGVDAGDTATEAGAGTIECAQ